MGSKERERALTDREKAIKTYILDMKESRAENIRCGITREIFSRYKEGGLIYDKLEEDMRRRYPDLFELADMNGKKAVVRNLLKGGVSLSAILEHSGLPIEVVEEIAANL